MARPGRPRPHRPFADEHQLRVGIADGEDELVSALCKPAALAIADEIADRLKRGWTLLCRQNGTEGDERRDGLIADGNAARNGVLLDCGDGGGQA